MQEMQLRSLGQEDALEKGMATHSSSLAWRLPWTGEPGGLQSRGSQRIGHDWVIEDTHIVNLITSSEKSESVSRVQLFVTWCTVTPQGPVSMGFSRQDTGVACYFLFRGIFPTGIKPGSPALQACSLLPEPPLVSKYSLLLRYWGPGLQHVNLGGTQFTP